MDTAMSLNKLLLFVYLCKQLVVLGVSGELLDIGAGRRTNRSNPVYVADRIELLQLG